MAKRKNKDPGAAPQLHPQRSFDQMVADATLARLGGYIDEQIQGLGQALLARQQQNLGNVVTRLRAVEEIMMEKLGMTKDDLSNRVASIQDKGEGFEEVNGAVESGDRVRLEVKTRTVDQTEFQGASRIQVDGVGSGQTLGKELENALLGLKTGETKELLFGKDSSMFASLTVNRISRQPKPEAKEEAPAPEAPNASADAG